MNAPNLESLAKLLERERDRLLARWREQVKSLPSARHLDTPTLNDHIPTFLEELAAAFRQGGDETIVEALVDSPAGHGVQRLAEGFDIVEVVAEYNILRATIYDLAEERGLALNGSAFHILNRVLDGAIGLSVQTFAEQQALEVKQRREEYLAFVAHDLRTPLNAIALSARVIEVATTGEDAASAATRARMLTTLHRNVQRLETLVDAVLKENVNVQTESGVKLERREIDLWPLVEGLIHDLHPVAGTSSTRLVNDIPLELTAFADASLVRRVFQNLVANAITYTPRGAVVIGARETAADGAVECWVSDDGTGISPERRARIFERVETEPQKAGVTGLGLAIVKTFVEAHGGHVAVESNPDRGSTFRFDLPGRPG